MIKIFGSVEPRDAKSNESDADERELSTSIQPVRIDQNTTNIVEVDNEENETPKKGRVAGLTGGGISTYPFFLLALLNPEMGTLYSFYQF